MAKMVKKTSKGKMAAGIAVGVAAAAAAAVAGYYFYGSKKAKSHRKIVAKWANDMKKEVIREVKSLEKVNPKDFARVVDTVASTYRGVRSVNAADLRRAANELKANWKMIQREIQKSGKKTVKKIVKKAKTKKRKSR